MTSRIIIYGALVLLLFAGFVRADEDARSEAAQAREFYNHSLSDEDNYTHQREHNGDPHHHHYPHVNTDYEPEPPMREIPVPQYDFEFDSLESIPDE